MFQHLKKTKKGKTYAAQFTYLVPILFTCYIQGVLKLKKNNYGAKSFRMQETEIEAFHPSIAKIGSHQQWLQWT